MIRRLRYLYYILQQQQKDALHNDAQLQEMAHNFRLAPPGWAESDWPTDESDFPEDVIAAFFQDSPPPTTAPPTNKRHFAAPVTSNDVQQAKEAAVPKSTRNDTKWCMKLWDLWSSQRPSCSTEAAIPTITALNNDQLQHWLCRFILEVRKENGQHYPPATLHHIVSGIMRFLRQSGRQLDSSKILLFRSSGPCWTRK